MLKTVVLAAAASALVGLSPLAANALTLTMPSTQTADAGIVQVYGGCGIYGHRGPYGGCRPGGQAGGYIPGRGCPPGWHVGPYGRRCVPNRW